MATGDIIVHISGDKIGSILIPVPPLAEQDRIVARIAEINEIVVEYGAKESELSALQTSFLSYPLENLDELLVRRMGVTGPTLKHLLNRYFRFEI